MNRMFGLITATTACAMATMASADEKQTLETLLSEMVADIVEQQSSYTESVSISVRNLTGTAQYEFAYVPQSGFVPLASAWGPKQGNLPTCAKLRELDPNIKYAIGLPNNSFQEAGGMAIYCVYDQNLPKKVQRDTAFLAGGNYFVIFSQRDGECDLVRPVAIKNDMGC